MSRFESSVECFLLVCFVLMDEACFHLLVSSGTHLYQIESRRQNALVEPQLLWESAKTMGCYNSQNATFCDFSRFKLLSYATIFGQTQMVEFSNSLGKSCFKDMSFCVLSKAFLTDVSKQKRIQHAEVSVSVFSTSFADFLVDHDGRRQEGYLGPVSLQPQKPAFWLVSDKLYIFLPQLGP